jgi:hypothetical protein
MAKRLLALAAFVAVLVGGDWLYLTDDAASSQAAVIEQYQLNQDYLLEKRKEFCQKPSCGENIDHLLLRVARGDFDRDHLEVKKIIAAYPQIDRPQVGAWLRDYRRHYRLLQIELFERLLGYQKGKKITSEIEEDYLEQIRLLALAEEAPELYNPTSVRIISINSSR